jgi:hypothetical protein
MATTITQIHPETGGAEPIGFIGHTVHLLVCSIKPPVLEFIAKFAEFAKYRKQKIADGAGGVGGGKKIASNHDDRKRVGLRHANSCYVW